jgi:hypothetical protein
MYQLQLYWAESMKMHSLEQQWMNSRRLGYSHFILMCFLNGSISQKTQPEDLSKINWSAREVLSQEWAAEEASQPSQKTAEQWHRHADSQWRIRTQEDTVAGRKNHDRGITCEQSFINSQIQFLMWRVGLQ